MSTSWNDSTDVTFRGILYNISLSFDDRENNGKIIIDLENIKENVHWQGVFSNAFISNVTSKSGSPKDIFVFARMIQSALWASSKSVTADILAYQDLEQLMSHDPNNEVASGKPLHGMLDKTKRYLLLTYTSEFESIRYPLPLNLVTEPTLDFQQRLILRLRREIDLYKALSKSIDSEISPFRMDEENSSYRASFAKSILSVYRQIRIQQNTIQEYEKKKTEFSRKITDLEQKTQNIYEKYRTNQATIESMKKVHAEEVSEIRRQLGEALANKIVSSGNSQGVALESRVSNVYYPRVRELSMDPEKDLVSSVCNSIDDPNAIGDPQYTKVQPNHLGVSLSGAESQLHEKMHILETENKALSIRILNLLNELKISRDEITPRTPHSRVASSSPIPSRNSGSTTMRSNNSSRLHRQPPQTPSRQSVDGYHSDFYTMSSRITSRIPSPTYTSQPVGPYRPPYSRLSRSASMSSQRSDYSQASTISTASKDSHLSLSSGRRSLRAQRVPLSSTRDRLRTRERTNSIHSLSSTGSAIQENRHSSFRKSQSEKYVSPYSQRHNSPSIGHGVHTTSHLSPLPPQSPLTSHARDKMGLSKSRATSQHSIDSSPSTGYSTPRSRAQNMHSSNPNRSSRVTRQRTPLRGRLGKSPVRSSYVSPYNQNILRGKSPISVRQQIDMSSSNQLPNSPFSSSNRSDGLKRQLYNELNRPDVEDDKSLDSLSHKIPSDRISTDNWQNMSGLSNESEDRRIHNKPNISHTNSISYNKIYNDFEGYLSSCSAGASVDLSANRNTSAQNFFINVPPDGDKNRTLYNIKDSDAFNLSPGNTPASKQSAHTSMGSLGVMISVFDRQYDDDGSKCQYGECTHSTDNDVGLQSSNLPMLNNLLNSETTSIVNEKEDLSDVDVSIQSDNIVDGHCMQNLNLSVDIDDIDKRLANLQNFLSNALI